MKRKALSAIAAVCFVIFSILGITACGENKNENESSGENLKKPTEGLKYTLSYDETYYVLSGIGTAADSNIVIPDEYNGLPVKMIDGAFAECKNITSVTIGGNLTRIGSYAFYDCENLTSITYKGTKAQWSALEKGDYWDYCTGNYTIHCTDGDITKL